MPSRFPHPLHAVDRRDPPRCALNATFCLPANTNGAERPGHRPAEWWWPGPSTACRLTRSASFDGTGRHPERAWPKLARSSSLVFLVGGAFTVVDETGALRQAVGWLVRRCSGAPSADDPHGLGGVRGRWCAREHVGRDHRAGAGAAALTRRLGFDAVTAVAISLGAAGGRRRLQPDQPLPGAIAQKLAGLPLLSGAGFRLVFLGWRSRSGSGGPGGTPSARAWSRQQIATPSAAPGSTRAARPLALVIADLRGLRVRRDEARLGLRSDVGAVLCHGRDRRADRRARLRRHRRGFVDRLSSMAYAGMLIGFARAIFVVLDQGRVIDTVVNGLVLRCSGAGDACALGMVVVQAPLTSRPQRQRAGGADDAGAGAAVGPDGTLAPGRPCSRISSAPG